MRYLLIPHIEVQRANALATAWAITMTPVFACTLFAHALGRDIGIQPAAVAIIHHDAQFLAESDLPKGYGDYPHQFRAATYIDDKDYSSKNKHALSLQPTASMHLEISLLLLFADTCPSLHQVKTALSQRRIAGGLITHHGKPSIYESFEASLKAIHHGFFVIDQSHELVSTDQGRLETLLSLVNDPTPEGESRRWLSPAVLGYATLTPFEARTNARENAPHAFAEPLVGLVAYQSIRQITAQGLAATAQFPCFWRGHWPRNDVFITHAATLSTIQQEPSA